MSDGKFFETRWVQSMKGGEARCEIRSARVRVRGPKDRFVCRDTTALCRTVESYGIGCLKRIFCCAHALCPCVMPMRQET